MYHGTLPVHPTARHPHTGAPLRALYVRDDGRIYWPIIGASPDDGGGDGGNGGDGGSGGDKGGAGGSGGGSGDQGGDKGKGGSGDGGGAGGDKGGSGDKGGDLGFPANTPVAEMTLEQQVAYHRHQSRKHEQRAREWQGAAGDKTPEQIKAALDAAEKARQDSLTDAQRQVEDAQKTARIESAKDGARAALELALGHDPEKNDQSDVIDVLDMGRFLTDDGRIDTAKVRAFAAKTAPSDKGQGNQRDYGGGSRGGQTGTGVAAGRSRYQERHGKKTDKVDA
jgi:hypothetical protein